VDIGADPTTWPLARGIEGYTYNPLSYQNHYNAYFGNGYPGYGHGYGGWPGYGGNYGGGYGNGYGYGYHGYDDYYGGYGYANAYNGGYGVAQNPYRHFFGHGRYDLGRFSWNYRGHYRNNAAAKTENEAYLAHVATLAKNRTLSPKK